VASNPTQIQEIEDKWNNDGKVAEAKAKVCEFVREAEVATAGLNR